MLRLVQCVASALVLEEVTRFNSVASNSNYNRKNPTNESVCFIAVTHQFSSEHFGNTDEGSITELMDFSQTQFLDVGAVSDEGHESRLHDPVALLETEVLEGPRHKVFESIPSELLQLDKKQLLRLPYNSCQ